MSDELRRLKAQQDAQSAKLHQMQMQMQAQQARRQPDEEEIEYIEETPDPRIPNYVHVNQQEAMVEAIAQRAAQTAAQQVQQNIQATQNVQESIKTRMNRLVSDYPAIQDENSPLTVKARDAYARISQENSTLDEATKYELAVREAASLLGARPVNAPLEDIAGDFLMGTNKNYSVSQTPKAKHSRLTQNILKNAMALGVNVDASTPEGKKNLAELNEYSARFNADQDEQQFRYK